MNRTKVLGALFAGASLITAGAALAHRASGSSGGSASNAPLPVTPKQPVVDTIQGVAITDDYRWLENNDDADVAKWSDAENAHTRATLDSFPSGQQIQARVGDLIKASSVDYADLDYKGGLLFALKTQPPRNQPLLVTLKSVDDLASEHVVLDPNQLDPSGHTAIDFFVPSLDGKKVAVSLSQNGSESGTVHVYDSATGTPTPDSVPRVNGGTAGGSLAWNKDGTGFFYTRYPTARERAPEDLDFYQQIYFHRLGADCVHDLYSLGKDFPRIAEVKLTSSDDGKLTLAQVANGDGGQFAYHLRGSDAKWVTIAGYDDKIISAVFGKDDSLYVLSRKDAPRGQILKLAAGETALAKASMVMPQSDAVIETITPTATKVYVTSMLGGPERLDLVDPSKKLEVPTLPVSAVGDVVALDGDDVLFRNESYLNPPAWMHYAVKDAKVTKSAMFKTYPFNMSGFEVVREVATSKDGTKVPMSIVRHKGLKLGGANPTLLYAYGGYGISEKPHYSSTIYAFLEQGGTYVDANIRGGGEFGAEWHEGGNLTNKQKDYDDFTACAQHLFDAKYTNPSKLAILGGSNGGLLMGVMLTQHPNMFAAVVAEVGIMDMMRVEHDANGAFNVTEFGTVTSKAQFEALYAYSPFHHVVDHTAYPPTLFMTGAHDPRVAPYHSRKMVARLQAATSSRAPILLRVNANAGHGIGTSMTDRIAETADMYTFMFKELGMTYQAPARSQNE